MAELFSRYASGVQWTAGTMTGSIDGVSGLNPILDRLNSITTADNLITGSFISGTNTNMHFSGGTFTGIISGDISGTNATSYTRPFQEDGFELTDSVAFSESSGFSGSRAFGIEFIYKFDANTFNQDDVLKIFISAAHNNNGSATFKLVYSGTGNAETSERSVEALSDTHMEVTMYGGFGGGFLSEQTNSDAGFVTSFSDAATFQNSAAGSLILAVENSATDYSGRMVVKRVTN